MATHASALTFRGGEVRNATPHARQATYRRQPYRQAYYRHLFILALTDYKSGAGKVDAISTRLQLPTGNRKARGI